MKTFIILLVVALLVGAIGFLRPVYFKVMGYSFSAAAVGLMLLFLFRKDISKSGIIMCALLVFYGLRMGVYLLMRRLRSGSYRYYMQEMEDDGPEAIQAYVVRWITTAVLIVVQVLPLMYRFQAGKKLDFWVFLGILLMLLGLFVQTLSDLQKSAAKKRKPENFVSHGLFRIVRNPHYFGELLFWTGILITGIPFMKGVLKIVIILLGYLGIWYQLLANARTLEIRQNGVYGENQRYRRYVKRTPAIIPYLPPYSLAGKKWLIG